MLRNRSPTDAEWIQNRYRMDAEWMQNGYGIDPEQLLPILTGFYHFNSCLPPPIPVPDKIDALW